MAADVFGASTASPLALSEIRFRIPTGRSSHLVAYASCVLNGSLLLNDIQVHNGPDGLHLVYPSRTSASGARHYTFNPISRPAAQQIETAILSALRRVAGEQGRDRRGDDTPTRTTEDKT